MKYDSTPYRILRHFANNPGLHRAVTIGELFVAINAVAGTAVHQRLTIDVRGKGWQVVKTDEHRYWMPAFEAKRALKYVKQIHAAHQAAMRKAS